MSRFGLVGAEPTRDVAALLPQVPGPLVRKPAVLGEMLHEHPRPLVGVRSVGCCCPVLAAGPVQDAVIVIEAAHEVPRSQISAACPAAYNSPQARRFRAHCHSSPHVHRCASRDEIRCRRYSSTSSVTRTGDRIGRSLSSAGRTSNVRIFDGSGGHRPGPVVTARPTCQRRVPRPAGCTPPRRSGTGNATAPHKPGTSHAGEAIPTSRPAGDVCAAQRPQRSPRRPPPRVGRDGQRPNLRRGVGVGYPPWPSRVPGPGSQR
jgi:hypothetical protein